MESSIYKEWLNLQNPNNSLYERIQILMDSNNLKSASYGDDHKTNLVSLFINWSIEQPNMAYSDLTKAYDAFFDIYKNNTAYFTK